MTFRPRDFSNLPSDAEAMPFPSEDITPPVTNIYFGKLHPFIKNKIFPLSNLNITLEM